MPLRHAQGRTYTVTRQLQWPEGRPVVEVSAGDLDYANPDALAASFPGELATYDDPREAAETAIRVCEAWRAAGKPDAQVAHGATGGMTMPFEPCSYEDLREWAALRFEAQPKCDGCGQLLPARHYEHPELPDERYCSEACAEMAYEELLDSEPVDFPICESCLSAARAMGVAGQARQAALMVRIGDELDDHACDAEDDPVVCCACACRGARATSAMQPTLDTSRMENPNSEPRNHQ